MKKPNVKYFKIFLGNNMNNLLGFGYYSLLRKKRKRKLYKIFIIIVITNKTLRNMDLNLTKL